MVGNHALNVRNVGSNPTSPSTEPSLWDTKIVPCDKGVCIHTYHGKGVGWTATKFFWNKKEAEEWLKGGIKSTPDPNRKSLPRV